MASLWGTRRLFSTASRLQTGLRNPYIPTPQTFVFPIRNPAVVTFTAEQEALKNKEKGSWKDLTLDEKRELYRMKFPLTLVEERASRGEGKWVLGTVGCWLSISFLLVVLQKQYLTPKPPHTVIKEWNDLYLLTRIPPTRVKE